jgi:hypothetical protein
MQAFDACVEAQTWLLKLLMPEAGRPSQPLPGEVQFEDEEERSGFCICFEV